MKTIAYPRYSVRLTALFSALAASFLASLLTGCGTLSVDPLNGACVKSGEYTLCYHPVTGSVQARHTKTGRVTQLEYDTNTKDWRADLSGAEGSLVWDRDGGARIVPPGGVPVTVVPVP